MGVRALGIPTLAERLTQQAVHQVLSPIFEPAFSASRCGFRPERSAHHAALAVRHCVAEGRRVVVDRDPEKFFDRVGDNLLMEKPGQRIGVRRVLQRIRHYPEAGMMAEGVTSPRGEGTPQGGPLSPLLSNTLLTHTRARNLMKVGLAQERALRSACNQPGPGWISWQEPYQPALQ